MYTDMAETNDGRVIAWGLQDLKASLDALVEQQRIANIIAVFSASSTEPFFDEEGWRELSEDIKKGVGHVS